MNIKDKVKFGKKLHKIIWADIKEKGLCIKNLPKDYPISVQTIYRASRGDFTNKTIQKMEKHLNTKLSEL